MFQFLLPGITYWWYFSYINYLVNHLYPARSLDVVSILPTGDTGDEVAVNTTKTLEKLIHYLVK